MRTEIPIFFSTDEEYLPFLDVAVTSLLANASPDLDYRIIVLNTGLDEERTAPLMRHARQGVRIDFVDISSRLERVRARLRNVYHFSVVTYYRLFIASLFPEYDKALYLDCDLVVLGDISALYGTELGENVIAAAPEAFVRSTGEFRQYAETALGVDPDGYVNAGVLLINLAAFRENKIEEAFLDMIGRYDFDLLDPDQAYLNYLCMGKILALPNGWNKEPTEDVCEGQKRIVHYALYKKPWQYDDVTDGEYFWKYAALTPFYEEIRQKRERFGDEEREKKEAAGQQILAHAMRIVASDNTFAKKIKTHPCRRGQGTEAADADSVAVDRAGLLSERK